MSISAGAFAIAELSAACRMGGCQRGRAGKVTSLGRQDGDRATGDAVTGGDVTHLSLVVRPNCEDRLHVLRFRYSPLRHDNHVSCMLFQHLHHSELPRQKHVLWIGECAINLKRAGL